MAVETSTHTIRLHSLISWVRFPVPEPSSKTADEHPLAGHTLPVPDGLAAHQLRHGISRNADIGADLRPRIGHRRSQRRAANLDGHADGNGITNLDTAGGNALHASATAQAHVHAVTHTDQYAGDTQPDA